jgi:hypothetical protein
MCTHTTNGGKTAVAHLTSREAPMTERSTLHRFTAPLALVLAGLAGCAESQSEPLSSPSDAAALHAMHANVSFGAEVSSWLAGVRQATAAFHDIDAAAEAGWDNQLTGCMALEGAGAMGFHYSRQIPFDGTLEEFVPELLVYEPQKNGRLRLVALEYAIPFDAWTDEDPPSLHGIDFHRNEGFGLWVLHAWIWKHNPAGIFEDWNPSASCEFEDNVD